MYTQMFLISTQSLEVREMETKSYTFDFQYLTGTLFEQSWRLKVKKRQSWL